MKKIITATIIAALLCALLCGCGYNLSGGQPDGKIVSNNGIAVRQGDYIYYINGSMPTMLKDALADTPQAAIFRMNADGTDRQRVSSRKAYAMYIVNENIYFLSPISADRLCLFKVSINGGNERRLVEFENSGEYAFSDYGLAAEISGSIVIYSFKTQSKTKLENVGNVVQMYGGDRLYYYIYNKAGIQAISWEGGEPEAVTDRNGRIMGVEGNNIYYIRNDEKLTRCNMSTKEETTLSTSAYETMLLSLENNTMVAYSSEKTTFYLMHLDGSTRVPIVEGEEVNAYGVSSDRIFYCKNSEGALYSVDFNGNNSKKLADISALQGPGSTDPNYYMDVVEDRLFLFDRNSYDVYMINLTSGEVENLAGEQ